MYHGRLDKINQDVLTISASYAASYSNYRTSIDINRESIKEIRLRKMEPVVPVLAAFENTLSQSPIQYSDAPLHSLQLEFVLPRRLALRVD